MHTERTGVHGNIAVGQRLTLGEYGMVPIGVRALAWVGKYRDDVRPDLACGDDDGTLFLTASGSTGYGYSSQDRLATELR